MRSYKARLEGSEPGSGQDLEATLSHVDRVLHALAWGLTHGMMEAKR